MKKYNPNKTVSAGVHSMIVSYTDSCKHHSMYYEGSSKEMKDLQIRGKNSYQHIGTSVDELKKQKEYRMALYGLNACTPEEINQMSFIQKKEIISRQQKVQTILDRYKQEQAHLKLGSFLTSVFYKSIFAKALATYADFIDEEEKNTMSFKELGITKDMIIARLAEHNLLPKNFQLS